MITTDPAVLQSRLDIPPPPPEALNSPAALRAWLASSIINTTSINGVMFGYTVGTIEAAAPEDQDKPRFIYDDLGRYLGLAMWSPAKQGWSIADAQIGEFRTLINLGNSTPANDLAVRPMAGWAVADGSAAGIPDLRPTGGPTFNTFFMGAAPNWTAYTVGYTG